MLHVIDNYYAQTNNYGYSVLRDTGKQNLKTGDQTYITLGYVGTIKEALELVKKILCITISKSMIWNLHRLLDLSGSRRTEY